MKMPLFIAFMVASLAMALCFTVSCKSQAEKSELEGLEARAEVEVQNKALVKEYWGRFGKGENEKAVSAISHELHAPDIEFHMAQKEFGLNPYEALSDFQADIEKIIAEGDYVVARFIFRGIHSSGELGIPAAGRRVSYPVQIMYRFQNGKAKEAWCDWDSLFDLMRQLDMELKPKEGKE